MVGNFLLFENLNYAKSILRKKGMDDKNPEFIEIKELCKEKPGYLGLLTKLHFNDNVQLQELSDILSTLIKFNINVQNVLSMNYIELSDYLLDKESIESDNGYTFQFTDGVYDYFRVFTYEGILNCGSPAWCIKTKSNWDNYTSNDPEKNQQWVIIKKINKKLLTPNTNYLEKYTNTSNPMIRVGITFNKTNNKIYSFNDNDGTVDISSGKGKEIKENILKFMSGGKIEPMTFEKLLGREPDVVFDKNKKLFLLESSRESSKITGDVAKINDFMGFSSNWKLDGVSNYLYIIDNRFSQYIILDNHYAISNDGKTSTINPNFNQKVYYEICKLQHNGGHLPSVLIPIYLKLELRTKDEFISKNIEHMFFCKNSPTGDRETEYLVEIFINKNGKFSIQFVDMDTTYNKKMSNFVIIYNSKNPTYIFNDISEIYDKDHVSYKPDSSNLGRMKEMLGEDILQKAFDLYRSEEKKRKDNTPSTWKKIKNWKLFGGDGDS